MIDLYLVRHGETENNKRGILAGRLNMPLASTGIMELEKLASDYPYPVPELVFRSPLDRCLETARIVFHDPVAQGKILIEDNLIEMDFGVYDGTSVREFANSEFFSRWKAKEPDFGFPGGETFDDVKRRVALSVSRILETCEEKGVTQVGVVSHNMLITELIRHHLDADMQMEDRMCPNGMGYHLQLDPEVWRKQKKLFFVGYIPAGAQRPKASDSPYVKAEK
jgi:alpha-ribazole phosphatase